MQAPQLIDLLSRLGLTRDGDSFLCPAAHQVTVYVGVGREPLFLDRVLKIEIVGENVVVAQQKERYATAVSHVLAVRVASEAK